MGLDNRSLIKYGSGATNGVRSTIFDSNGTAITPATEAKQDDIIAALSGTDGKIFEIDEAAGSITYIGYADPGTATSAASWQIQRIDESANPVVKLYADGDVLYDNVWDNRASLSYS